MADWILPPPIQLGQPLGFGAALLGLLVLCWGLVLVGELAVIILWRAWCGSVDGSVARADAHRNAVRNSDADRNLIARTGTDADRNDDSNADAFRVVYSFSDSYRDGDYLPRSCEHDGLDGRDADGVFHLGGADRGFARGDLRGDDG